MWRVTGMSNEQIYAELMHVREYRDDLPMELRDRVNDLVEEPSEYGGFYGNWRWDAIELLKTLPDSGWEHCTQDRARAKQLGYEI